MNIIKVKKIFDPNVIKAKQEIENYLNKIASVIDLEKNWTLDEALKIEIKKSFIRGLTRFSKINNDLIEIIKKNFSEKMGNAKVNWITLFYPMIHLPNDKVEGGTFHYDDDKLKNFYTCWTPITEYRYSALSILKFQNFLTNLVKRVIIKLRLSNFFSENISVNKSDIFFWNGSMIHRGNINKSQNLSFAYQMKFTDTIYDSEPSINITKKTNDTYKNEVYSSENISNSFNKFSTIINLIIENSNNLKLLDDKYIKKILNFYNHPSQEDSFGFSMMSQRIQTHPKIILKKENLIIKKDYIINNLDLFSLLVGFSNYISLLRLLKNNDKNFIKNIIIRNDKFKMYDLKISKILKIY